MSNKWIFIFILIIGIVVVGFFVANGQGEQVLEQETGEVNIFGDSENVADEQDVDDSIATQNATYSIVLTENGYEPRNLSIRQGDTIVFSTRLDRVFWPASDVHPTHRIYSAFDPRSPVQPGSTYSFTFDRVGEWNYHDHLRSSVRGTITVMPQ